MTNLINLPRGGGKTIKVSKWCLANTKERGIVVAREAHKKRLTYLNVPEDNVYTVHEIERGTHLGTDITDWAVEEVGMVLNELLEMNVELISGTLEVQND